jgi:hypothetical protein
VTLSGDKTQLIVTSTLAGIFFITTALISIWTGRKVLKCDCRGGEPEPEPEYVNDVITEFRLPSAPAPPPGYEDDGIYDHLELKDL